TEIYTLFLHDALPIFTEPYNKIRFFKPKEGSGMIQAAEKPANPKVSGIASVLSPDNFDKLKSIMYDKTFEKGAVLFWEGDPADRSEEHTSELQSRENL